MHVKILPNSISQPQPMRLYYLIKIMRCFKRTINTLKTNKYVTTNGKKSWLKKNQLSDMIGEMQLHIAELENKFKTSEVMGNANTSSNQEVTTVDYFTDEEELAEETEWIGVKNKSKKWKMNTSPIPLQQQLRASEPSQQKDTSPSTDNSGWYKSI